MKIYRLIHKHKNWSINGRMWRRLYKIGVVRKKWKIKKEIEFEEGSGNVFADLGFENPEEELLKSELLAQRNLNEKHPLLFIFGASCCSHADCHEQFLKK